MNHLLFTIYDEKAEVFLPPFFVPTIGLATRAFADCINGDGHQFAKHPQDYTLFQLGHFDDHSAEMVAADKKSLGNGVEYVEAMKLTPSGANSDGPPNTPIQPNQTS